MNIEALKALFEELIEDYENADSTAIGECSQHFERDYKELDEKIAAYRQRFADAIGESQ